MESSNILGLMFEIAADSTKATGALAQLTEANTAAAVAVKKTWQDAQAVLANLSRYGPQGRGKKVAAARPYAAAPAAGTKAAKQGKGAGRGVIHPSGAPTAAQRRALPGARTRAPLGRALTGLLGRLGPG